MSGFGEEKRMKTREKHSWVVCGMAEAGVERQKLGVVGVSGFSCASLADTLSGITNWLAWRRADCFQFPEFYLPCCAPSSLPI